MNISSEKTKKSGFVAILGATNAGKSTLLNALVGEKIAIVTHKVQTTRFPIRGIAIEGETQLVFVDTPGLFNPKKRLARAMVASAWEHAASADSLVFLVDAERGMTAEIEKALKNLPENKPVVLAINKIDLVEKESLLELSGELHKHCDFTKTFMISATKDKGVKDLLEYLAESAPEAAWLFPEEQLSDLPLQLMMAEITREKVFLRVHEEVPYDLTVEPESWEVFHNGDIKIHQVIYVNKRSQRPILLGKGAALLKEVNMSARKEMEEALDTKVHLFLFVKVRENWQDKAEHYQNIGLEFLKDDQE
ncbi:MAG: GTPase Era [Alphaproteobacteria bacterium]